MKSQTKGPSYFSFLIFHSAHNKLWKLPQITDISPEQNPISCSGTQSWVPQNLSKVLLKYVRGKINLKNQL